MDRSVIERYAAGADVLARGVAGLTTQEMNSFPPFPARGASSRSWST